MVKFKEKQKHIDTHNKDQHKLQCPAPYCSIGLAGSKPKLMEHERRYHPELLVHCCTLCDKTYSLQTFLETHLKTHGNPEESGAFNCSVCTAHFLTRSKLGEHLRMHNGERFQCQECPKSFYKAEQFHSHMVKCHSQAKAVCIICGATSTSARSLETHIKRMHAPENVGFFPCPICQVVCKSKYNLKYHVKGHQRSQCEVCGFSVGDIKDHMKRKHPTEDDVKKQVCYFCGNRFHGFVELTTHSYSHTKERPFICHICHKDFTQKQLLTKHLDRHKADGTFFEKVEKPKRKQKKSTASGAKEAN